MDEWQIISISLIPVYCLVYFLVFGSILSHVHRYFISRKCYKTEELLQSIDVIGLCTYICGNIGCGKTTFGCLITNYLTKIKMNNASSKIEDIKEKLIDIDFKEIDEIIYSAFFERKLTNADAIVEYCLDHINSLSDKLNNKYYDNKLWPYSYTSLIKDYIDAYIAILRNNYVYFVRRKYYSWPSNSWSMNYDPTMIDVKDRYIDHDYKIQRYTTIFEDEKVLSGKDSMSSSQVASEDGGADTFIRLIRHFGKGSIHYISTSQDFERIVKVERELATSIIYIEKRIEIESFDPKVLLLNLWVSILEQFRDEVEGFKLGLYLDKKERILKKLKLIDDVDSTKVDLDLMKKVETSNDRNNVEMSKLRKKIGNLHHLQELNFADEYIRYKSYIYSHAVDVGDITKAVKLDCCGPISWAYGSTDTYSYSIFSDLLNVESISNQDYYDPNKLSIPKEDINLLRKYVDIVFGKKKDRVKESKEKFMTFEKSETPF